MLHSSFIDAPINTSTPVTVFQVLRKTGWFCVSGELVFFEDLALRCDATWFLMVGKEVRGTEEKRQGRVQCRFGAGKALLRSKA